MNSNVIKISDRIARNEDITMEEFTFLKKYIQKANKNKTGNSDDVVSNFVLDVREHYNPDLDIKWKEAWIYAHIKHAIMVQARFDAAGTLYSPVPVPITGYDVEGWQTPEMEFQINMEEEEIKEMYWMLKTQFEKDIYVNCILWNIPLAHIAKEYWKSAQWWKIVKDRIGKRIKDFIENRRS